MIFSVTMLSKFHFDYDIGSDEYKKYTEKHNLTDDAVNETVFLETRKFSYNFKMISTYEIIVFVWVCSLITEELKQVIL